MNYYIQTQQLDDEVSDDGLPLALPRCCLQQGIHLPVWLNIQLLLPLLQLLKFLCTSNLA